MVLDHDFAMASHVLGFVDLRLQHLPINQKAEGVAQLLRRDCVAACPASPPQIRPSLARSPRMPVEGGPNRSNLIRIGQFSAESGLRIMGRLRPSSTKSPELAKFGSKAGNTCITSTKFGTLSAAEFAQIGQFQPGSARSLPKLVQIRPRLVWGVCCIGRLTGARGIRCKVQNLVFEISVGSGR